ncbi:2-hydroxy-3-oxopropionate reductase [Acaryochloris thomasi RCC1774]|uniref:2-hydroxy-3-oxopropionate reductase n=1 Tax=Acaryochloris thomasi RCC1774 TaxID=1764569 RepID=A0A2W1JPP4_9CYAN|nr:2-hydroxy-3-oxopropionate reductase [Acaryochloris thomasi RCC1774]
MKTIAVLGLGAMGSRIAQNLLKAGHQVVVYNRTAEKVQPLLNLGAVSASTPREAAGQSDVVISMVRDDEASRAVWLSPDTGAVMGLKKDGVAIASSTLTVNWTKELATEVAHRGATFLDAPVVGSRPQAEAGKLISLVGGETATLAKVRDILESTSSAIHHVGEIGQGMAMKLAVNALFGIQVAAFAEVIGILSKHGLTTAKAMECIGELPITSPAARGAGCLMVANQHAPMFPIELVEKDFQYVLEMAQAVEGASPVVTAVREVYGDAIAKGHGDKNITGVVQLFV